MAPGVRPRVLVIDDDRGVRVFVCDVLEGLGYEADDAEGGVQGLEVLERHRYDIVITDLQMPNMSGWDVVEAVRGRLPTMPMIMISGFATEDDMRQAQAVGVPLLHKPFSVVELRRMVSELLAAGASPPERRMGPDVPRKPLMKAPEEAQESREAQEDQA
jgi:CheY-like chemotaxis protein